MSEDISELMDGELDESATERLVAVIARNEHAREKWSTYHAIGDALRATWSPDQRLQQRIFAALDQEATVLAPKRARWNERLSQVVMASAAGLAVFGIVFWFGQQDSAQPVPQLANVPAATVSNPSQAARFSFDDYLRAHQEFSPAVSGLQIPAVQPAALNQVDRQP